MKILPLGHGLRASRVKKKEGTLFGLKTQNSSTLICWKDMKEGLIKVARLSPPSVQCPAVPQHWALLLQRGIQDESYFSWFFRN